MEHPAGKYKTALLALRTTQVLISVINAILAVLGAAVLAANIRYIQKAPEMSEARNDPKVKAAAIGAMIGVLVFGLVLVFTCLVTCTLWLVYTAKPSARTRSCGGNKPACIFYSCDMGWDIFWAVLWGVSLIISLATQAPSVGMKIGNIITALIMLALFITTAVISGKVRKNLRVTSVAYVKDIEAASMGHGGAVKPFVMESPTVPTFRG